MQESVVKMNGFNKGLNRSNKVWKFRFFCLLNDRDNVLMEIEVRISGNLDFNAIKLLWCDFANNDSGQLTIAN